MKLVIVLSLIFMFITFMFLEPKLNLNRYKNNRIEKQFITHNYDQVYDNSIVLNKDK